MNFDGSWAARCHVAPMTRREAGPMIRRHYLKKWPGTVVAIAGLFCDGWPRGCITFSLPPRETAKRYGGLTWELSRMWVDDGLPRNTETWFLSRAIRFVKRSRPDVVAIVSYADPSAGHVGYVYRAANFAGDGMSDEGRTTPRCDYRDASGKVYSRASHVPDDVAVERVPRVSKHRYVLTLDRKARAAGEQKGGEGK